MAQSTIYKSLTHTLKLIGEMTLHEYDAFPESYQIDAEAAIDQTFYQSIG